MKQVSYFRTKRAQMMGLFILLSIAFALGVSSDTFSSFLVASKTGPGTTPSTGINRSNMVRTTATSTVLARNDFAVEIVVKNTSRSSVWTKAAGFALGSQNPENNTLWGTGTIQLADSDAISFGQTKIFSFTAKAPVTPGTYNFQWQMSQNGKWFGDRTRNMKIRVIQVTSTPPVATTTPSITVIQPNGGEIWQVGSQMAVRWTSTGIDSRYLLDIIRLRDFANTEYALVRNTLNDGYELVTIPTTLAPGLYTLEIKSPVEDKGVFDSSNAQFRIVAPIRTPSIQSVIPLFDAYQWGVEGKVKVTILNPGPLLGDAQNKLSLQYNIRQRTTTSDGSVGVGLQVLQCDESGNAPGILPVGSCSLTGTFKSLESIPSFIISGKADLTVDLKSGANPLTNISQYVLPITLSVPTVTPITIISPNGGEEWQAGSTQTVRWSGGLPNDTTFIYLYRWPFVTTDDRYPGKLAGPVLNTGTQSVVVPSYTKEGSYFVQLSSGYGYDNSDGPLRVIATSTATTTPSGTTTSLGI